MRDHRIGVFTITKMSRNIPDKIVIDHPLNSIRLKLSASGPAAWITAEY